MLRLTRCLVKVQIKPTIWLPYSIRILKQCSTSQRRTNAARSTHLVEPVFLKADNFSDRIAIVDQHGPHSYRNLLMLTNYLTDKICDKLKAKKDDTNGKRVAFLCPNDISYVVTQWSAWMSGSVAVPLSKSTPPASLEYFIQDSQSSIVVSTEEFAEVIQPLADKLSIKSLILEKSDFLSSESSLITDGVNYDTAPYERHQQRYHRLKQLSRSNHFKDGQCLIIYTSGTTGRPKGVVHTHGSIQAQMQDMVEAWDWQSLDVILHVLPLHHVHGVVNVLMTSLYCGATCVIMPSFNAKEVWSQLLSPTPPAGLQRSINLFMAVPTVYAKLIAEYEDRLKRGRGTKRTKEFIHAVCSSKIRLMVSGSAALPEPVMTRWEEITGHRLLERYGMTELGMGLTNPLSGPRLPGSVGMPFPRVEACIAAPDVYSDKGYDVLAQGNCRRTKVKPGCEGAAGELYIKGPSMFKHYWNKPEATADTFTVDGWFKTGDTACFKDGTYRILGRTSVDIIKSGGYKLSALDIERQLLSHSDIKEVAVVGLPDVTWGQRVAAIVVLVTDTTLNLNDLREWSSDKMSSYQLPSVLKVVDSLPRNAMGKINKKELTENVFSKELKQR